MTLCDICAAEGYPYDEEICKGCEYNPSRQRSDDMYCKTFEWDDIIKEHETTTFEPQNEDCRGYADTFKCTYCDCMVNTGHYMRTEQFDYNYCPYCGRPVESEVQDGDK